MTRIGVFLCTCDGKIDKGIQVDAIRFGMRANPDLAAVATVPHLCLPDGLQGLEEEIRKQKLDRVVLAACPERLQGKRLRDASARAGVNTNHVSLVDWREGCAWAHRGDRTGATAQAIDLIQMALARVQISRAVGTVTQEITPHVLIIGGGISGMTAARSLADRKIPVTLVEREPSLGGHFHDFPIDRNAAAYEDIGLEVLREMHVEVRLESRVVGFEGSPGNYRVKIESADASNPVELQVGAVIVATGAREYPGVSLSGHDSRDVVTLGEFEKQLAQATPPAPSSVVYQLCAGSRNKQIPYCSKVCCLRALSQAVRFKRANPNSRVTILFRDLYLDGDDANSEIIRDARQLGIEFLRYAESTPPIVDDHLITFRENGNQRTHCVGFEKLVLATPLVPQEDAGELSHLLRLSRDENGFFPETHERWRPEYQAERGIFVCGSAHRPVDVDSSVLQALAAAARAAHFVKSKQISRPEISAFVSPELCTGCAQCIETCAFNAIRLTSPSQQTNGKEGGRIGLAPSRSNGKVPPNQVIDRAIIDPFLCGACGNCVVACPSKAIGFPLAPDIQILAQVEAALSGRLSGERRIIVFGCKWSGFASMELAGARRKQYSSDIRVIELPCAARLDSMHVLYAFLNGADRVTVALCPPDECHFVNGNSSAEGRLENLKSQLAVHGIDPGRLNVVRLMGDDANAWLSAVEQATSRHGNDVVYSRRVRG